MDVNREKWGFSWCFRFLEASEEFRSVCFSDPEESQVDGELSSVDFSLSFSFLSSLIRRGKFWSIVGPGSPNSIKVCLGWRMKKWPDFKMCFVGFENRLSV